MSVETEDEKAEFLEFFGSHPAIVTSLVVEFSDASWEASVTNSGGSCASGEGLGE